MEKIELEGPEPSLLIENSSLLDLDEQLIVGLRRREGVNLEELAFKWGWNKQCRELHLTSLKEHWESFLDKGLLEVTGNRVRLTDPEGMEISNSILVEMLIWWDSLPIDASTSLEEPL